MDLLPNEPGVNKVSVEMIQKKRLDLDKKMKGVSGLEKMRYIMGCLCFIICGTFVMIHLGFVDTDIHHNYNPQPFLTREQLWLVNLGIGVFGGALLGYPRFLLGALSGLIAAAAVTGSSLLYLSWRENIYIAEIVIPIMTSLIGIAIYNTIKPKDESLVDTEN